MQLEKEIHFEIMFQRKTKHLDELKQKVTKVTFNVRSLTLL